MSKERNRMDGVAAGGEKPGVRKRMVQKLSYGRWLPSYAWQRLTRSTPRGEVHLIVALADHFEPAIVPENGRSRAPFSEQERRVEHWCSQYPQAVDRWRDQEGRPLVHTYFYPAEQYDRGLVDRLAEHCHGGCGEIEIHLPHGLDDLDTAENTRRQLVEFRDALVVKQGSRGATDRPNQPRYPFAQGKWALANSARG